MSRAHRNDLDVWQYVNDSLQRLIAGETDYESMLPRNWGGEHPRIPPRETTGPSNERAKRRVRTQHLASGTKP